MPIARPDTASVSRKVLTIAFCTLLGGALGFRALDSVLVARKEATLKRLVAQRDSLQQELKIASSRP